MFSCDELCSTVGVHAQLPGTMCQESCTANRDADEPYKATCRCSSSMQEQCATTHSTSVRLLVCFVVVCGVGIAWTLKMPKRNSCSSLCILAVNGHDDFESR